MNVNNLWIALLAWCCISCKQGQTQEATAQKEQTKTMVTTPIATTDKHSFSRPAEVVVRHIALDLNVDFDKKVLSGTATCAIENITKTNKLVLDTRDLTIEKVTIGGQETTFKLGEETPHLGRALEIDVAPDADSVTVHYKTSPQASALQWLSPQQTAGKKSPFLFTQSQAILARTWVPCQDSPGIRMTYSARVQVPKGLMAVMSATNPTEKNKTGIYEFKMDKKIPAYLLALAVGDLEFEAVGKRTGIYAEPAMLEKSVYEFKEMDKMLTAAEKLYGAYAWGRYDLIVLPPSFPFGGMENPRLTFATPTVIAGDRSLTSLVAHELAHSWSGNLVTNATWEDFWLNEGFTVYFERRIMEELYGKDYAAMLELNGLHDLKETIKDLDEGDDTKLKLSLADRNPDDGVSDIAYEKGYFLLRTIEENVGREKWDQFINKYFTAHAFQSVTTEQFLAYLDANLLNALPEAKKKINIDRWVYERGLPEYYPKIKSVRFENVDKSVAAFLNGTRPAQLYTKDWTSHEWLRFLRSLPADVDKEQMVALDQAFHFTNSGNAEVLCEWFVKTVNTQYKEAYPAMEKFLVSVGRRKFLSPIYSAMMKSGTAEQKQLAKDIYRKARPNYHFVATSTLDNMVGQ